MIIFFETLYAILILAIIIASAFIVFHISRYSYDKTAKKIMLAIFISVAGVLLYVNLFLFTTLPLKEMLGNFINY